MEKLSILIPFRTDNGPRERIFDWLMRRYDALLPDAEVVIGTSPEPFSRSAARNDAFRRSHGDVLLIADADTLFHVDQIVEAVALVEDSGSWVLPYKHYYNLSEVATERVMAGNPNRLVKEPCSSDDWEFKLESWAGLLVMPREAFETVGGYCEQFVGWGFEDNAFRYALDTLWGPYARLANHCCLHLWHPASEEVRFGQPYSGHNRQLFQQYVAACGDTVMMSRLVDRDHLVR